MPFACASACCVADEHVETVEVTGELSPETEPLCQQEPEREATVKEAPGIFTLTMERVKDLPIGLDVDLIDGVSLVVTKIKDGFMKLWNEKQLDPLTTIQVHDRIVEVNGKRRDAQALATELHHTTTWELKVSRPTLVSLLLEHAKEENLGLDLFPSRGGMALLIAKIGAGFFQDWLQSNPNAGVLKHDRIVKINGITGTSHQLLRALHAAESSTALQMEILHYEPLPDTPRGILQPRGLNEGGVKVEPPNSLIMENQVEQ